MELFYQRGAGEDGGSAEAYARPEAKKTLMLHYIFVTALLLEDCQLAPAQVCRLFPSETNLVLHQLGTSSQVHLLLHLHIHVLATSFRYQYTSSSCILTHQTPNCYIFTKALSCYIFMHTSSNTNVYFLSYLHTYISLSYLSHHAAAGLPAGPGAGVHPVSM